MRRAGVGGRKWGDEDGRKGRVMVGRADVEYHSDLGDRAQEWMRTL